MSCKGSASPKAHSNSSVSEHPYHIENARAMRVFGPSKISDNLTSLESILPPETISFASAAFRATIKRSRKRDIRVSLSVVAASTRLATRFTSCSRYRYHPPGTLQKTSQGAVDARFQSKTAVIL